MAKRLVVFLLCGLFILSNNVFAANWVYLQRQEGTRYGSCTEYFDMDSVVKENNKVVVWLLWVMDETGSYSDIKKILFKQEILLANPLKTAHVAMFTYDKKGQEINRHPNINSGFYDVRPGSMEEDSIERVLQQAVEGRIAEAVQPDNMNAPGPVWCKAADLPDCELYLDITSLPRGQNSCDKFGVIAKFVWNEQGLRDRKTDLAEISKKTYPLAYEKVQYTLMSYQFLAKEKKSRIYEITDYNEVGHRITLLDGIEWHDIEAGSRDEAVLQAVLSRLPGCAAN